MQVMVPVIVTQNILVNINQPITYQQNVLNTSSRPIIPASSVSSSTNLRPMMDPITPPTYQTINLNKQSTSVNLPVNFVIRR